MKLLWRAQDLHSIWYHINSATCICWNFWSVLMDLFSPSPCSVSQIKAFGAAQQLLRAPDVPVASGNSPPPPFFRSWLGWDKSSEIETSLEMLRKTGYSHEDSDVEYTPVSWLQCRKGRSWLFYPQSPRLLLLVMQFHRFSLSVTSQSMTKKFKYKIICLDWCLITNGYFSH